MSEDGKVDVTCPKCAKVRAVARYSVAASWLEDARPALAELRERAFVCRTCKLLDSAAAHLRAHGKAMAEVSERRAKGL